MRHRLLSIGLLVVLVVVAAPIAASHADTVDAITAAPNQTLDKDYAAIVGQDPTEASSNAIGDSHSAPTPDNCATLPSCNVIPLTFQVPKNFDKRDTYVATISLFWDRQFVDTHEAGESVGTEDYDMYLWAEAFNEPECTKAKAPKPDYCTTDLALSANGPAQMPEIIRVDVSSRQKFLLEVSQSGGAAPYRVHIESTYFSYSAPAESLGGSFTPTTGGSSSSAPLSLPSLTPGGTAASSSTPTNADTSLAALSPTGDSSGLDSDVTGINGTSLSSIINAGPLLKAAKEAKPGAPPSGSSLVFWMLLVPIVLVGVASAVFVRRRPRALRI